MNRKLEGGTAENENADQELEHFKKQQINKESGGEFHEEFAAEATPYVSPLGEPRIFSGNKDLQEDKDRRKADNRWLGITALTIAVLSLFISPALLGIGAVILGLFAWFGGQRGYGAWSVGIGLVSVAGYFILVPMYS